MDLVLPHNPMPVKSPRTVCLEGRSYIMYVTSHRGIGYYILMIFLPSAAERHHVCTVGVWPKYTQIISPDMVCSIVIGKTTWFRRFIKFWCWSNDETTSRAKSLTRRELIWHASFPNNWCIMISFKSNTCSFYYKSCIQDYYYFFFWGGGVILNILNNTGHHLTGFRIFTKFFFSIFYSAHFDTSSPRYWWMF